MLLYSLILLFVDSFVFLSDPFHHRSVSRHEICPLNKMITSVDVFVLFHNKTQAPPIHISCTQTLTEEIKDNTENN